LAGAACSPGPAGAGKVEAGSVSGCGWLADSGALVGSGLFSCSFMLFSLEAALLLLLDKVVHAQLVALDVLAVFLDELYMLWVLDIGVQALSVIEQDEQTDLEIGLRVIPLLLDRRLAGTQAAYTRDGSKKLIDIGDHGICFAFGSIRVQIEDDAMHEGRCLIRGCFAFIVPSRAG